jgi:hypothetical protein
MEVIKHLLTANSYSHNILEDYKNTNRRRSRRRSQKKKKG